MIQWLDRKRIGLIQAEMSLLRGRKEIRGGESESCAWQWSGKVIVLVVIYNLNVGHATPRAIVPFGVHAYVDATEQVIRFDYNK